MSALVEQPELPAPVLDLVRGVPGFLTDAQARRLWSRARAVSAESDVVEIGSHFGKSTVLLGAATSPGVEVVAIDPHLSGPYASATDEEGEQVHEAFHDNLRRAGIADKVRHVRLRSQSSEASRSVSRSIGLLYVDGDHRYRRARDDLRRWAPRVEPGGSLFVHDCFSSPYVTAAVLGTLAVQPGFRYVGRERSLVEYVAEPLRGRARVVNLIRHIPPLAWLARNLAIKAALKGGRHGLARRLGQREPGWPY